MTIVELKEDLEFFLFTHIEGVPRAPSWEDTYTFVDPVWVSMWDELEGNISGDVGFQCWEVVGEELRQQVNGEIGLPMFLEITDQHIRDFK